jgi:hypothetical protein
MTDDKTPKPDYQVGYAKPPKHTQFKKGQSGRRKAQGAQSENNLDIFKRVCLEPVRMREGDNVCVITRGESVIASNYHLALKQHAGALCNMSVLAEQHGQFLDQNDPKQRGGLLAVPEPLPAGEYQNWARVYDQLCREQRELEELKAQYGISEHPWYKGGFHKQKGMQKF